MQEKKKYGGREEREYTQKHEVLSKKDSRIGLWVREHFRWGCGEGAHILPKMKHDG